jgi:hypothetical protein
MSETGRAAEEAGEYGANRVLGGEVVKAVGADWEVSAAGE